MNHKPPAPTWVNVVVLSMIGLALLVAAWMALSRSGPGG